MKFLKKIMLNKTMQTKREKKRLRKLRLSTTKKKPSPSNAPLPLPSELITKIICLLSIKTILLLKCVSKSWHSFISDPTFVQEHLKVSSQNPDLILTPRYCGGSVVSFPMPLLLANPSIPCDIWHGWANHFEVVGTCNGLLCLLFHYYYEKYWFCLWNPATRKISKELGTFHSYNILPRSFKFSFGCDILTGTYKVVAYRKLKDEQNEGSWRSEVKIFSLSDNCWRNIESFPLNPITVISNNILNNRNSDGVYLSGTVNWLALRNYCNYKFCYEDITYVEQFVIVSLDLSTETYTQFLLPLGFDEVPHFPPTLHVLMDCLCFSHDFKGIEFVIWKMEEFGVQKSWTQLFRIDYFNLEMDGLQFEYDNAYTYCFANPLLPLYLSKNGDTVILATYREGPAMIYNHIDKRVDRIKIPNILSWSSAMVYVESLVSTPCMSTTVTPNMSFVVGRKIGKFVQYRIDWR